MEKRKPVAETNRDVIELHLISEEGAVPLNEVQKELLQRWEFADEQIRKHEMKREQIAQLIMFKFKVSRTTAYQDIVNAENIFSSSTPLNKRYRIQLRIEFLEMKISELYGLVRMKPGDEAGNEKPEEDEDILERINRIAGNQEYLHEAKELEKILQKYLHDYSDIVQKRSPKTIIYNMQFNSLPAPALTPEQAIAEHNRIIHLKAKENGASGTAE